MTLLLYYSISSNLTENEIIEIDLYVAKNREFVRTFPSYSKHKVKRVFLCTTCTVLFQFGQLLVPKAVAIGMPSPSAIHRLSPIREAKTLSNKNECLIAATIPGLKADKIKLTNAGIKKFTSLAFQLNSGSITLEEAILRLRGGDLTDLVTIIAFVIFMNYYDSLFGTQAFQANPFLPHQDPFGWLGKYDSKNAGNGQSLSHSPSRFERETLHTMKQMRAASADENGFVMSYEEAYNLIKKTYVGSRQITENCRITDWQGGKKAYHFQGFGIDPDKYQNISKEDLVSLQKTTGGLIPYVQKGGKLPPIEFIRDGQQKIYDFCHLESTEINRSAKHYGKNTGETPCIMFFNRKTEQIALFNKTSGDLITAEKFRPPYFNKCVDSGQVGKPTN